MKTLSKQNMNEQKGFTLIELVVVIVILGILAVTAAPKFIDLQGDARGATLQGVKAAIETATAGVHAKSLIAGNDNIASGTETVSIAGATIEIGDGWQDASVDNFNDILDIDSTNEFTIEMHASDTTLIYIYPKGNSTDAADAVTNNCYVSYDESTSSNIKPVITVDVTGC